MQAPARYNPPEAIQSGGLSVRHHPRLSFFNAMRAVNERAAPIFHHSYDIVFIHLRGFRLARKFFNLVFQLVCINHRSFAEPARSSKSLRKGFIKIPLSVTMASTVSPGVVTLPTESFMEHTPPPSSQNIGECWIIPREFPGMNSIERHGRFFPIFLHEDFTSMARSTTVWKSKFRAFSQPRSYFPEEFIGIDGAFARYLS
jgi:hypothetical protein